MESCAVIWDVDGTLVDTAELHFQAWCILARELGQPFTRADFARTFGWRNPEIIPLLFGMHAPDEIDRLGNRKEDLYRAEAQHGVELLPGVRSLLTALADAGCRQAVGSSAAQESRVDPRSYAHRPVLWGRDCDGGHAARQARSAGVPDGGGEAGRRAAALRGDRGRAGRRPGREGQCHESGRRNVRRPSLRGKAPGRRRRSRRAIAGARGPGNAAPLLSLV